MPYLDIASLLSRSARDTSSRNSDATTATWPRLWSITSGALGRIASARSVACSAAWLSDLIANTSAWMINSVEFSPDGRLLLTASDDKTARVWNARTGDPVGFVMQHADRVNSAQFSPNGKWVVTASADNAARLWPVQTGRSVGEALRFDKAVRFASFSPDGKWMVTGGSNNTAQILETQTGKLVAHSTSFAGLVVSAVFSPDGTRVVSTSVANAPSSVMVTIMEGANLGCSNRSVDRRTDAPRRI